MSRAPVPSTNGIQEFYTPRPTLYSSATSRRSMPRVEQQYTQRHIQLSDIQKPKELRSGKKEARPSGGSQHHSFWSWLSGFLNEVKTKASTQVSDHVPRTHGNTLGQSHLSRAISDSDPINSRHSTTSSMNLRIREAQQAAREDQLEYEAQHYSLWGEILYIYKSLKVKRAKKKAEVARQKHHEVRQKTREEQAKLQVALVLEVGLPEEQMAPTRHPTPSPQLPLPPRLSQQIKEIAPETHLEVTGKPVQAFSKTEGEVRKHAVKITHLPPVHNSVHLQQTPANTRDFRKALETDHKRKSSNITTFGDFMRKPSEPSERLARLPPHTPTPVGPQKNQRTMAESFRQRNGTQWTFTVPGIDEVSRTPILPNVEFPGKISEERESQVKVDPQECILCGALNSPRTHYNQQGLWLCTACRSPKYAKEVPPTPTVPRKLTSGRYQNRSGSSSRKKMVTRKHMKDESAVFAYEYFSEPEPMRASMRPAPLHSLKNRHPHSSPVESPVSPLTVDPFSNFDAEINFPPSQQTPLSPDFQIIIAQQSPYKHSLDDETPPTPPLKDDYAYWPPRAPSPAIIEAPLLSSKSFKPPKPQSAWSESTTRDSNRLSYYQDTPTSPKALPQTPKSPLIPQRSKATRAQTPDPSAHSPRIATKRRTADKGKNRESERTKTKERMELRTPPGIPSDFPFAPPPIPEDTLHKPKRSSSIYPEDETYTLPPFDFTARVKKGGEKRDTSFYDFWKTILEERRD